MGFVRKSWILGFLLLFHATAESFQTDLGEGSGSGDVGPIDDEDDYGSGSGSLEFDPDSDELPDSDSENGSEEDSSDDGDGDGDGDSVDEEDVRVENRILEGSIPNKKSSEIGDDEKVVDSNEIAQNVPHVPVDKDVDNAIAAKVQSSAQGSSLQRTEVLAAIIAGGVVGLLMAIALIAFLVLRMRKKEEGNCIVGKNAEPAYQRANTEIYA